MAWVATMSSRQADGGGPQGAQLQLSTSNDPRGLRNYNAYELRGITHRHEFDRHPHFFRGDVSMVTPRTCTHALHLGHHRSPRACARPPRLIDAARGRVRVRPPSRGPNSTSRICPMRGGRSLGGGLFAIRCSPASPSTAPDRATRDDRSARIGPTYDLRRPAFRKPLTQVLT